MVVNDTESLQPIFISIGSWSNFGFYFFFNIPVWSVIILTFDDQDRTFCDDTIKLNISFFTASLWDLLELVGLSVDTTAEFTLSSILLYFI